MVQNTGGRVNYTVKSQVRILCVNGKVSNEVYEVESDRSDRKGHVTLIDLLTKKQVKVQYRRILPVGVIDQAIVIESGGKCRAICPKCTYIQMVSPQQLYFNCGTHGQHPLYWLGERPMTQETAENTVHLTKTSDTPDTTVKSTRRQKEVSDPIVIDLNYIANLPNCELWTRKHVKFDHPNMNVQSHILLFIGDNPRKMCFNTYNGTTGKKHTHLPFDAFVKNVPANDKKDWYAVTDLSKTREKLMKDGYEKN